MRRRFSIDQDSLGAKCAGIRSMIHYVTQCEYMLIPLASPVPLRPDGLPAEFPEQIARYGKRSWCRCEFFLFSLLSEMSHYGQSDVRLHAVGSDGVLKQFDKVEFNGEVHAPAPLWPERDPPPEP